jgi:hypothetical protein
MVSFFLITENCIITEFNLLQETHVNSNFSFWSGIKVKMFLSEQYAHSKIVDRFSNLSNSFCLVFSLKKEIIILAITE